MTKQLGALLAEERLLMSEEKWIVEALQQIKIQRNSLQIEKLHLQSMKANLQKHKLDEKAVPTMSEPMKGEGSAAAQAARVMEADIHPTGFPDEMDPCNQKEMDLSITNRLTRILGNTFQEEYDEDDDESEEDHDFFTLGEDQQSADVK